MSVEILLMVSGAAGFVGAMSGGGRSDSVTGADIGL